VAKRTIVVIDDEPSIRKLIRQILEREDFDVADAGTGEEGLTLVERARPAVVLLDLTLPDLDGTEVLRRLRETTDVPVILLTGRAGESDRVLGLDLGADDYVVKPFLPRELAARVRAADRRRAPAPKGRLEVGEIAVDATAREVFLRGDRVDLTPREFDVLAFLASSPRTVFSREQLLSSVWDSSSEWQDPDTVTEHIRRLRHKLEDDPSKPARLVTVRGAGYRLDP
jgi:two-component system, OmpR family, phosphate regulon response regulator PhoB